MCPSEPSQRVLTNVGKTHHEYGTIPRTGAHMWRSQRLGWKAISKFLIQMLELALLPFPTEPSALSHSCTAQEFSSEPRTR